MFRLFLVSGVICQGCQTSRVVHINASQDVNVRMASFSGIDQGGESLGKTPLDVETKKLKDKILILSQDKKQSQYWFFPDENSTSKFNLSVSLKDLNDKPEVLTKEVVNTDNFLIKTTLTTYAALNDEDYVKALSLAQELVKSAPKSSASHLLLGIVFFQKGQKSESKAEFEKARTLDPSDPAIERWLKEF